MKNCFTGGDADHVPRRVDTGDSGGKWLIWKFTPVGRTIVFRSNDRYAAETRLNALTTART
jgi:hypothetical protein